MEKVPRPREAQKHHLYKKNLKTKKMLKMSKTVLGHKSGPKVS